MLRHVSGVHGSHPSAHELSLLQAVLDLLLSELVFDIETEWHGAFVLLAVFGMVAAKSYELFAHRTATVGLALAALGVLDNPFHLLAGWQRAVCVAALAGVDQGLDAALDAQPSRLLGALGLLLSLVVALVVQTQAPLDHLVVMALSVVAVDAEVVVLQGKKRQSSAGGRARTTRAESSTSPLCRHTLGARGYNHTGHRQDDSHTLSTAATSHLYPAREVAAQPV